jgi:hypothetical protein
LSVSLAVGVYRRRFAFALTNDLEMESGFEFENQQRFALRHARFLVAILVGEGVKGVLHALRINPPAPADIFALLRSNTLVPCCWPSWWSMAVSCS